MIDERTVREGLAAIFADLFGREDIAIEPGLTAKDVAGWDSFKQVELVMAAEERFGLRFTSPEVDGFRCLGDLMSVIAARGR